MTILVCGGRDYSDQARANEVLDAVAGTAFVVIVQGGCRGADRLGKEWAKASGFPDMEYKADWDKHGKAAGPIRNQRMIDEGKPDLVVAFPGGKGTADMVCRAKKAGVKVMEVAV